VEQRGWTQNCRDLLCRRELLQTEAFIRKYLADRSGQKLAAFTLATFSTQMAK
jgi:hypothetical protein